MTTIEKLKQDFTDKYVMVDGSRPELSRFNGAVGMVKTVNMSGRALVEFLDYHNNTGWYDIELAFLKVVDKPAEKPAKKEAPAAKPAAEKAAPKPAAKAAPAAGGEKKSVADILAAARGKAAAPAAPAAGAAPAKKSTADILAAARAKAAAAPAPAKEPEPAPVEPEPVAEEPAPEPKVAAPAKGGKANLPKSVPDILAFCRKVDAKK